MSSMDFEIQHKRICAFTHNSEDVIVNCVNADNTAIAENGFSGVGSLNIELREVDTREVTAATGLMFLGVKGEGIKIDTISRSAGVVLVRLYVVEVITISYGESILTIELDVSRFEPVNTSVKVKTVVEGLLNMDEEFRH